ncbi:hypothetical protein [Ilumatobacter sp.]|uniref:hypothetical protein n=1 Tax=Ilumatobacter sp. TaxID=1967498 RepID=UPI003B5272BF
MLRGRGRSGETAIVNLTPVGASGTGYGQLVSSDVADPPVAANVNHTRGSIDPNVALAPIGADGEVCSVNGPTADVFLVADQIGRLAASVLTGAGDSGAPRRLVDTRDGAPRRLGPTSRLCVAAAGDPGDATVVNLTPVRASGTGYGQLVSSDVVVAPVAANVNYTVGSIDPNVALAPIGADGEVCFVNGPTAGVDLVADQIGAIDAGAHSAATTTGAPERRADTRVDGARLAPSQRRCFPVDGAVGDAAVVNLTPVRASGTGYGQLVSSDAVDLEVAANVNYTVGSIDPNVALAPIGADGEVCFVNGPTAGVDLVADQIGAIAADRSVVGDSPVRVLDTRTTAARRDLVLRADAVGYARFGADRDTALAYLTSGLSTATSTGPLTEFTPTDDRGFPVREDADGRVFEHPWGQSVCWSNDFCAQLGGDSPDRLELVGYTQWDGPSPLATEDGVRPGSRWAEHLDVTALVAPTCYTTALLTTRGIDVFAESRGSRFIGLDQRPRPVPDPRDVVVVGLGSGDRIRDLVDC